MNLTQALSMKLCHKCETEYERDDECMCPQYGRWCDSGQRRRVPREWKLDWWDGYVNDEWDCNHTNLNEWMDGSSRCLDCGLYSKCDHAQFSRQSDGTAKCDLCGVTPEWSK